MINRVLKGVENELLACIWFHRQGYQVFRNIAPCGETDIVILKDKIFTCVDVKQIMLLKDGVTPSFDKGMQRIKEEQGVEILYAYNDGTFKWARDADPYFGKRAPLRAKTRLVDRKGQFRPKRG